MTSIHRCPCISFPFLLLIRLLTQTPESIFLKSKTNSIRALYLHQCRHTYRRLTPACSILLLTLKSVREPRPESLYGPAHWTRQGGVPGFAAHYLFIELIMIRIITFNVGWGKSFFLGGGVSKEDSSEQFLWEQQRKGYWICQAWTLYGIVTSSKR